MEVFVAVPDNAVLNRCKPQKESPAPVREKNSVRIFNRGIFSTTANVA
jgi:hypothetical protein